jgi:hypothetical protein
MKKDKVAGGVVRAATFSWPCKVGLKMELHVLTNGRHVELDFERLGRAVVCEPPPSLRYHSGDH